MLYQQGDVLIELVAEIPYDANLRPATERGHVLAEGEETGHFHVTRDNVLMYEKDGVLYLRADESFTVSHDEHKPVTVPAGRYRIRQVREFDPFTEAIDKVRD